MCLFDRNGGRLGGRGLTVDGCSRELGIWNMGFVLIVSTTEGGDHAFDAGHVEAGSEVVFFV